MRASDSRSERLLELLRALKPVPREMIEQSDEDGEEIVPSTLPCDNYRDLVKVWRKALKWRQDMDDVLSLMLAICISTDRQGDQVLLQVIGNASSGKSRFCDALAKSMYCHVLEHLTGFFSGWKRDDGEDYSLLARIDKMTLVSSEGDVLMSNPKFGEIMSQFRRIFDGSSASTYKTEKEDKFYDSLRITWIMAGTPTLLEYDQSRLGDRFLKVFMESPTDNQRQDILERVGYSALDAVKSKAAKGKIAGEKLEEAYRRTGGYVNWLRENDNIIEDIDLDEDVLDTLKTLADFTTYARARPGKGDESRATKEEPYRLYSQYVRIAVCAAAVMNRTSVCEEVIRRVRKVALNTSDGVVLDILHVLHETEKDALPARSIAIYIDKKDEYTVHVLRFLKQIGAVELASEGRRGRTSAKPMWRMTKLMKNLYEKVYNT